MIYELILFTEFFCLIFVLLFLFRSELFPFDSNLLGVFDDGSFQSGSFFVTEENVGREGPFGFDRDEKSVFDDSPISGSFRYTENDSLE